MIKEHEHDILNQFRKQLMDENIITPGDTIGTDDFTLLRFLRARKLKIEEAKEMVINCQEWRKTVEGVGMDALYDEIDPLDYPEKEVVLRYWPFYYHKTDKEGHPVHIQAFGRLDVNALLRKVDKDRQWKALLVNCELGTREVFPACSKVKGSPIASSLCLVDVKGFSIQKFWTAMSYLKKASQIAQDYYPETLAKMVLINAPSTFTFIWAAMRPWISAETASKIVILGEDYKKFLLEYVDPENLPTEFGGTCTCEGLGGCTMSSDGPWLQGRVYTGRGPSKFKPSPTQESEKDDLDAGNATEQQDAGSIHADSLRQA